MGGIGALQVGRQGRFEFVDLRLFREGIVNRQDLADAFEVSHQQASADFARYLESAPNNATYERSAKSYVYADGFNPNLSRRDAARYLANLRLVGDDGMDARSSGLFDRNSRRCARTGSPGVGVFKNFVLGRMPSSSGLWPSGTGQKMTGVGKKGIGILWPHPEFSEGQRKVVVEAAHCMAESIAILGVWACFLWYFLEHFMSKGDAAKRPQNQDVVLLNKEHVLAALSAMQEMRGMGATKASRPRAGHGWRHE